jgi:hypothetical protein
LVKSCSFLLFILIGFLFFYYNFWAFPDLLVKGNRRRRLKNIPTSNLGEQECLVNSEKQKYFDFEKEGLTD